MKLDPESIKALLAATLETRPQEIDCLEWLDKVAGYAELRTRGEAIPAALELVHQHLTVCPECTEEFEALLDLLDD